MGNDVLALIECGFRSKFQLAEDEYRTETRARIILFLVIVALAALIGATIYLNSLPSSPLPESPRPSEPHMSPFVPSNESWGFESGSGARDFSELLSFLVWGTIGVLALLTVYFSLQAYKRGSLKHE